MSGGGGWGGGGGGADTPAPQQPATRDTQLWSTRKVAVDPFGNGKIYISKDDIFSLFLDV